MYSPLLANKNLPNDLKMRNYCKWAHKYLVRIIDFENRFRRISTELAKLLYFHFQVQNKMIRDLEKNNDRLR